ncbi:MAG: hypothetical protein COA86_18760 [Kangiella sp.]|nr:MAG: hypothetical protein COA86_18760 [Kangiella sp.]
MKKPKLLVQLRIALRSLNYALSTEKSYVAWVRQYILYHNKRHPIEMGCVEVGEFLSYFAVVKSEGGLPPMNFLNTIKEPRVHYA